MINFLNRNWIKEDIKLQKKKSKKFDDIIFYKYYFDLEYNKSINLIKKRIFFYSEYDKIESFQDTINLNDIYKVLSIIIERSLKNKNIFICSLSSIDNIRYNFDLRVVFFQNFNEILDLFPLNNQEKEDRIMLNLSRLIPVLSKEFIPPYTENALFFSKEDDQTELTLLFLQELDYLYFSNKEFKFDKEKKILTVMSITKIGLIYIRKLLKIGIKRRVFALTSLKEDEYKEYKDIITKASQEYGFDIYSMNKVNNITSEVIYEIKKSSFAIIDLSNSSDILYFASGVALGIDLPLIFTCKEKYISRANFEKTEYNYIQWENTSDLEFQIKNRIKGSILLKLQDF